MQTTTTQATPAWREIVPRGVVVECQPHMEKVHAFAVKTGRVAQLRDQLKKLANLGRSRGRVRLYWDFAPYSFGFAVECKQGGEWMHWISGGLIFHGSHDRGGDGGAPTLAVNVSPHDGWSIHT